MPDTPAEDHGRRGSLSDWRGKLHEIIFEADTFGGKLFDVALILSIIASVIVVMLDSVRSVHEPYGD